MITVTETYDPTDDEFYFSATITYEDATVTYNAGYDRASALFGLYRRIFGYGFHSKSFQITPLVEVYEIFKNHIENYPSLFTNELTR
jgi:hypothetical protein